MRSVMMHQFSQVPSAEIPRSVFDRSHGLKTTLDAGWLVPILVDEALPGDSFNLRTTLFARLATPIRPIMDNLRVDTFFFAVPIRLIWNNWHKFNGAQDNPGDSTSYVVPTMTAPAGGYLEHTLSDYFGIPTKKASLVHASFWHRAYNLVWNEWFRDQNLQNSVTVDKGDGPDAPASYVLLRRGKRHDYFTSCLPWPQKGTEVTIPLGTEAPLKSRAYDGSGNPGSVTNQVYVKFAGGTPAEGRAIINSPAIQLQTGGTPAANDPLLWQQKGDYLGGTYRGYQYADLSTATAATINALRRSFQIQKLYERDARGGTRYVEIIRAHFGVVSPDFRLQRPEYLGGGSSPVTVHPVAQTSSTDATTPQGSVAALGVMTASGHGFSKSFTEHCVILGLVNIRADLNYQQGLNRMFSRSTRWDFYWPALSQIGEQSVLNKEIYAQVTADDDLVFGYQERYAEYRYKPSQVTGLFRSNATGTLHVWHLSQNFTALPALNSTFIQDDPPVDRVIAVPAEPHLLLDCYFQYRCARPMPVYGVPGNIDRF